VNVTTRWWSYTGEVRKEDMFCSCGRDNIGGVANATLEVTGIVWVGGEST
jgi:hypothetical protein